jgi:O-antigen biosynthesis protein
MTPLVSVIVPCYNQAEFLPQLIESVANACHHNHEIIIINDGSTDESTFQILKGLTPVNHLQNIKIFHQPNQGLSETRNRGIHHSKGDFVQLLDADDLLLYSKIDDQLEVFNRESSCSVVICDYLFLVNHQLVRHEISSIKPYSLTLESFLTHWERGLSIPVHCPLYRREIISQVDFNTRFRAKEDWIFFVELCRLGVKFHYNERIGAIYRQHQASMCKNHLQMAREWLSAGLYLSQFSSEPEVFCRAILQHYQDFYLRAIFSDSSKLVQQRDFLKARSQLDVLDIISFPES